MEKGCLSEGITLFYTQKISHFQISDILSLPDFMAFLVF